jgi:hypothetical protein
MAINTETGIYMSSASYRLARWIERTHITLEF